MPDRSGMSFTTIALQLAPPVVAASVSGVALFVHLREKIGFLEHRIVDLESREQGTTEILVRLSVIESELVRILEIIGRLLGQP